VDSGSLLVALTAGMVAAFNPCGFALLPAYLAMFLGDEAGARSGSAVGRALGVGAAVTVGFVAVFGIAGILISSFAVQVAAWTPYLTVVVGPLLVALGVWLLSGRELTVRLPRLNRSVGAGPGGMVVYGVVYATVSLSCTIPVFLVAVVGSFRAESFLAGVVVLVTYAVGMGLVLTALAVAVALARDGLVSRSRRILPYLNRVSGALLVVAGAYVTWYGYVEIRILGGDLVDAGPVDTVAGWAATLTTFADQNAKWLALLLAAVVLVGVAVSLVRRRRDRATAPAREELHESA
jgi:cytochrome c biogenesis protein CcdA